MMHQCVEAIYFHFLFAKVNMDLLHTTVKTDY